MFRANRRSAMKVRDGIVQRKNRWARTPHYLRDELPALVIDRRRPGRGYHHVASQRDVRRFLEILPEWSLLREGLNAIVLDSGYRDGMGWHRPGVVAICAWDADYVWSDCLPAFYAEHAEILEKLGIPVFRDEERIEVQFTEDTARAFLLVHVLVHELGHHHDRITTRSKRDASRGEGDAERYARRHEDEIIAKCRRLFDG
jgi:hypothetical protein